MRDVIGNGSRGISHRDSIGAFVQVMAFNERLEKA
jgi:hypothetical protein